MLEKELSVAESVALEAGEAILTIFHEGFEVNRKQVSEHYSEPVTIADIMASRIIVERLAKEFPSDGILSEEEVDDVERRLASKRVWIIDPLDGTKGFTEKRGDFAVQIGLVDDGEPILGVVYQPLGGSLYVAAKGAGSFLTSTNGKRKKLETSDLTEFTKMTMAASRSHRSRFMNRIHEHFDFGREYRHGSVGLKVGFLASGTADIYIHMSPHTKYWDTAAPETILTEAGGILTDIFGDKIDYTRRDVRNHNGIFATNGPVHEKAIAHLRPLLTEFGRLKVKAQG